MATVGEPIVVNVDAFALADDTDLSVVVVPQNTPYMVADQQNLFANTPDVVTMQMPVTVGGRSEVHLYSIPDSGGD